MHPRALWLILSLVPALASAQEAAPTPERIVEAFGSWEMRCQRVDPADAASPLACEVTQEARVEGAAQPVTRIAIGRPSPDAVLTAVVQLPLGLWLPSGAAMDLGTAGGSHALQVLRCVPQGCIAELPLTDAMVAALSDDSAPQSALAFEMQPGSPARVPVVHAGFGSALAALQARLTPAP